MRVKYSDGGIIYVKDVITAEADPKEKRSSHLHIRRLF